MSSLFHRVEDKKRALHHEVRGICIALYTTQAVSKRNKQQKQVLQISSVSPSSSIENNIVIIIQLTVD